jgi:hypothetical protein
MREKFTVWRRLLWLLTVEAGSSRLAPRRSVLISCYHYH